MQNGQQSVRIGRVFGVEVSVHFSWLLIVGLIILGFWGQLEASHPTLDAPTALALSSFGAGLFFGSILLHELAHAIAARIRGIGVNGITLYLFGGATETDASSRAARDEFTIAIVGPMTSFALAGVFGAAAAIVGGNTALTDLLIYLATANVLLAVFNMAPGLPLDGGRVFRSIVWGATGDFERATKWATTSGVWLGYILISVGLLSLWQGAIGGLWLVAIGWMISQSARATQYRETLKSEFSGLVAADIMSSPVTTIPAETSIADSVRDYFSQRVETTFPVVDGKRVCGLLSVAAVRRIPASEIWRTTAGQVSAKETQPVLVNRRTPMEEVLAELGRSSAGKARALVIEDDVVVGIISPSDIVRRHSIADLVGPALAQNLGRRSHLGDDSKHR